MTVGFIDVEQQTLQDFGLVIGILHFKSFTSPNSERSITLTLPLTLTV